MTKEYIAAFDKDPKVVIFSFEDNKTADDYHYQKFLANNNIEYNINVYPIESKEQVINALNTWIDKDEEQIKDGPIITYRQFYHDTEVHVDIDEYGLARYTLNHNGYPVPNYTVKYPEKMRIVVIRNREQLENSDIIKDYFTRDDS